MSDPITDPATSTAGAGTPPGAGTGGSTSAATTTPEGEKRFTQAEVNAILARQKREDEDKRKTAEARARQQAAEEEARKAGEWQKLADTATAERDRLSAERESVAAERDALAAELEAEIKARLKALPDELRDLVPADASPAQRFAALRKVEAAAKKLGAGAASTPGTPTGPRGAGGPAVTQPNQADLIEQKRRKLGAIF